MQVFLAEKHFEGCGGLQLTDEIRVTIAAQACLLLLHRATDYFPRLSSILVYPSTYKLPGMRSAGGGLFAEGDVPVLGHTAQRAGALVLAWDSAKSGAADPFDAHNTVLHEFAHQLDFEDGLTDGTPRLDSPARYAAWARVLGHELEVLRVADRLGTPTLLNKYGATNTAEFFAVVTEFFFEQPHALRARHPELYEQLQQFFRQDPTLYLPAAGEGSGRAAG